MGRHRKSGDPRRAPRRACGGRRFREVDLYAPDDEGASDLIDGSMGEKSPFHDTFGYYAHGVGPRTAVLPREWRSRASVIRSEETRGVTGFCPDPADLAVSKLAAWREKNQFFVQALLRHGLTTAEEILSRLDELDSETATRIRPRLASANASAQGPR